MSQKTPPQTTGDEIVVELTRYEWEEIIALVTAAVNVLEKLEEADL